MKAPVRLVLYGLVLVVVFVVAFATAGAVVPEETVQDWTQETEEFDPVPEDPVAKTTVDGFDVMEDDLAEDRSSQPELANTGAGEPVTELASDLGAFEHLAALHEGGLAPTYTSPHWGKPKTIGAAEPENAFESVSPNDGGGKPGEANEGEHEEGRQS